MFKSKVLIILLTIVISTASCVKREEITSNYENGQVHEKYEIIRNEDNSFVKDGLYSEFYKNGLRKQEGNFRADKAEGSWTFWHENGKVAQEIILKNGLKNGICEIYHSNGQKEQNLTYVNDTIEGVVQMWDQDGNLQYKMDLKKGKWDGKYFKHVNGKVFLEADFTNGLANGTCKVFNEEGSIVSEAKLEDGVFVQRPFDHQLTLENINFNGFSTGTTTLGEFSLSFLDKGIVPEFKTFKDGSKRISLKGNSFDLPQITEAIFKFDVNNVLRQIKLTMPKNKSSKYGGGFGQNYNAVRAEFAKKYKVLAEKGKNSFGGLGNRFAKFGKGNNIVTIDAPHLSFKMEIVYSELKQNS